MSYEITASEEVKKNSVKPSFKELVHKYSIYLPLFIISIFIAVFGAYVYLKYQPPVYSSGINVFFPEESKGGSGGADASVIGEVLLFDRKVNLTNETQMLKTTSLMERVVEKLKLNTTYHMKGKSILLELYKPYYLQTEVVSIKDSAAADEVELVKSDGKLYQITGENRKPITANSLIAGNNVTFKLTVDINALKEDNSYFINWEPVSWVAAGFAGSLSVSQPQTDANILNISINTEDPQKGVDILNALVIEHNIKSNQQKDRLIDYTLQFIDERVELMRGELGKVEGRLQGLKENQLFTPQAASGLGLDELTSAEDKAKEAELKLQKINLLKDAVSNPNQPIPTTLGVDDPLLGSLVGEYNQTMYKKEEQLRTMPAANPMVKNSQAQLDRLRSGILNNLESVAASTRQMKARYSSEYSAGRSRLRSVPGAERQLIEVSRQQEIKEKLFLFLLQRKEEAAMTKAANLRSNAMPMDPAYSMGLISPIPKSVYQKFLLIALLIPAALIYLRELLNDKITSKSDITGKTNTPIIGEITHNKDKKRRLVVSFDDRSVQGEQFRMLRANLPFFMKSPEKKIILFTSSSSGDGKTFCSLNLGAVYALAGKKTVIVEMDLRKPKLADSLGMSSSFNGITNFITGQSTLKELPIPVQQVDNLYVVTAGIIPPNPSEILMDEKITEFFDYLKKDFDYILVDCAPLGLVSDAKVLARYADMTIYVIRQRVTPKKHAFEIDDIYRSKVFDNFCLLVNDVKTSGVNSYYGYGDNLRKNYKYTYGMEEKTIWQKTRSKLKTKA